LGVQQYKAGFFVVTAILALFAASPALQRLLVMPQTEFFTELWLLGAEHRAEGYPYNVTSGETYTVYLGIANHLGSCGYYVVQVKFRNSTESAPNSFNRTCSTLPSLYNLTVFVADKAMVEVPVTFTLNYSLGMYNESLPQVTLTGIRLNGLMLKAETLSVWNAEKSEFYGSLFFELWIYNSTTARFQYHERYVSLRLNLTAESPAPA
jgi:uncharacterized membrane protein